MSSPDLSLKFSLVLRFKIFCDTPLTFFGLHYVYTYKGNGICYQYRNSSCVKVKMGIREITKLYTIKPEKQFIFKNNVCG